MKISLFLSVLLFLASCGGAGSNSGVNKRIPGCSDLSAKTAMSIDTPEWVTSTRIGQTQQLSVTFSRNGQTVTTGCDSIVWATSNPQVATVSASGRVRAMRIGQVTVTAGNPQGGQSDSLTLTIESGVPSDQPVNMYTTWTARRVQHSVIQVDDRLYTARNIGLDDWCCKYGAPWTQGGIVKYHWNNDRVGLLSDVVDGAGTFRVVERAREWEVLAKDTAVDFQLFQRMIILLDTSGSLRVKPSEIFDPWVTIASSGIAQFRAQFLGSRKMITVVRTDGLLFSKEITGGDLNREWVARDVGGQVASFKESKNYIAALRTDGVFGVFNKGSLSSPWRVLADSGVRDFAVSNMGIVLLLDDGRLRGKFGVDQKWTELATGVESFKVDGYTIAAQQVDGRFRVKKELNGPWRTLSSESVLAYAIQGDETGEYIGYVGSGDRVMRVVFGAYGSSIRGRPDDALPAGNIGPITVVADVREPPTRTISTSYPNGSRSAAPPNFGLSSSLRSYPDDQLQCMRDNTVPWEQDGKAHNCRWVSESFAKCLFEDGPGLPNVVTCYGRFCGGSVPNTADWDWANNVGAIDSFDQLCLHHDKSGIYYSGARDGGFDACIVRYGIEHGRLSYGGRQVLESDPEWNSRWATMPNILDVIENYQDLTSGCGNNLLDKFTFDTASPRTQDPPD